MCKRSDAAAGVCSVPLLVASRRRTGLKAAGLFTPLFLFAVDFVGVLASGSGASPTRGQSRHDKVLLAS